MNNYVKGVCLCIFGGICWGLSGVLGKYLFDARNLTAVWLVCARLLLGGTILLTISRLNGSDLKKVWTKKRWTLDQFIFAIIGMGFCQLTYFVAIEKSNPATATVLVYLSPVIILLYTTIRYRKRPTNTEIGVLVGVTLGVFIMITHCDFGTLSISKEALAWGLFGAVCYAVNNTVPLTIIKETGTLPVVGWGMLISGIIFGIVNQVWHVAGQWDMMTFLAFAGVIVFGTVLSFTSNLAGISLIGPVRGSMLASTEPLTSTILTAIFMSAGFGMMDIVGILIIVVSVSILAVKR